MRIINNSTQYLQVDYSKQHQKQMKILHISDLHITRDYEINSSGSCGFPLCCKKGLASQVEDTFGRSKAGKWGNYQCDIPQWLIDDMLQHIREYHQV